MNGQTRDGAPNTVTNVGHGSMRVFTVPYATAVSCLARVLDPRCGEQLTDTAGWPSASVTSVPDICH